MRLWMVLLLDIWRRQILYLLLYYYIMRLLDSSLSAWRCANSRVAAPAWMLFTPYHTKTYLKQRARGPNGRFRLWGYWHYSKLLLCLWIGQLFVHRSIGGDCYTISILISDVSCPAMLFKYTITTPKSKQVARMKEEFTSQTLYFHEDILASQRPVGPLFVAPTVFASV